MGVVGCGAANILLKNAAMIAHRARCQFEIVKVAVRNPKKPRPVNLPPELYTTDPYSVVTDPRVDIVVEVMGGLDPSFDLLVTALKQGKSVVTANKELLAKRGSELLDIAKEMGTDVYFEASVAGGIPIITALKQSLAGKRRTDNTNATTSKNQSSIVPVTTSKSHHRLNGTPHRFHCRWERFGQLESLQCCLRVFQPMPC